MLFLPVLLINEDLSIISKAAQSQFYWMESISEQQFQNPTTISQLHFCLVLTIVALWSSSPLSSILVSNMFSSKIALYLAPSIFPSSTSPVLADEKENFPTAWCGHHNSYCMVVSLLCCILCDVYKENYFLVSSDQSTSFRIFAMSPTKLKANRKQDYLSQFQGSLFSYYSSIKDRFFMWIISRCSCKKFSHMSCGISLDTVLNLTPTFLTIFLS